MPKQVLGCTQLSGAFGRQLDKVSTQSGLGDMVTRNCRQQIPAYKADIARFVKEYVGNDLCWYKSDRVNKGFRGFRSARKMNKSPVKLGCHLRQLSTTLSFVLLHCKIKIKVMWVNDSYMSCCLLIDWHVEKNTRKQNKCIRHEL